MTHIREPLEDVLNTLWATVKSKEMELAKIGREKCKPIQCSGRHSRQFLETPRKALKPPLNIQGK